ncbi:MAG: biopolymer transporter ExbD [Coleofasciculaceae cyanobacterium]
MRLPDDSNTPLQINIVPMIDVLFCILAFFIISSLSLIRSQGLPVNLPKASTAQSQLQEQIVVTIDVNGAIFLNRQPLELANLAASVGDLVGEKKEALVVINADSRVSHGAVVSVIDRLNQVNGVRLAIAAQRQ